MTHYGHATPGSCFHDAPTTQLNKLLWRLQSALYSSSTTNLVDSGNAACMANTSLSWVIDSHTSKHISSILFFFFDLTHVKHQIVLANSHSQPIPEKGALHPINSLPLSSSLYVPNFLLI